jgi:glycosyltransferase involved in cell wall biosynthesis
MKYPYVIFFRYENYSVIDKFFIDNNEKLNCSIFFTCHKNDLNKLFDSNYQILVTFGEEEKEYITDVLSVIPDRIRSRWIHFNKIDSIEEFSRGVNYCFIHNCTLDRESIRPIFSIFTPAYNSYNKIERAYNSLINQTFKDWEFVVIDDSPDDNHFNFLRKLMISDSRVRLFRKSENNGNIGNLKNEAVSLCRGKYILEFDHDDEILPFVLQDAVNCFENNPEIGFIYMDCILLYENGINHFYGDFISKGYGNYYCQKYNDKWVNVYNSPNINNITLSHLVCCPNHPRIWRKSSLINAGNYSELLPICDDYEIILRTALTTKIAKICKFGYIQYMNNNNNNFSLIRNAEINRIGPYFISPIFYNIFKINEHMKTLNAYEDEKYIYDHVQLWKRDDDYQHKFCNKILNPDYDFQYCIIGIDSLILNKERIYSLYADERNDFIILDNKCYISHLQNLLDRLGLSRFKCYSLIDESFKNLEKYFMMYKSCEKFEIINTSFNKIKYNCDFNNRNDVINHVSIPENKYLEIGIENGYTFKNVHFIDKIGIDPEPYFTDYNILKFTSDQYFSSCTEKFDIIFIDGMHQIEYLLRDFNNSIYHLNPDGKILIDDILPLHYDEQLKIPKDNYYENGILKTSSPWTGDLWKFIYHILLNYKNYFDFEYFYNINYRGIACIQIKEIFNISLSDIDIINKYTYNVDFGEYLKLLQNLF